MQICCWVLVPLIQNRMGQLSMGVEQRVKAGLQPGDRTFHEVIDIAGLSRCEIALQDANRRQVPSAFNKALMEGIDGKDRLTTVRRTTLTLFGVVVSSGWPRSRF